MCKGWVSVDRKQGAFRVFWGAGLLLFRVHVMGGELRGDLHLLGLGSDSLPFRVMGLQWFSVWEACDEREVLETFFWLWCGGMTE